MEVREQILLLARDIVQQDGIDAVSFRILADKVGVKSSSVHYYFPKKDDLIFAIIERYLAQFKQELASIREKNSTAKKRLRRLVALFRSTRKQDKVCLCGMIATVSRRLDKRSRLASRLFFNDLHRWVLGVIEEGQTAGEFEGLVSSKNLAAVFVSTLEGGLLIDHLNGSNEYLDAAAKFIEVLVGE